jgi:hypothetical protein
MKLSAVFGNLYYRPDYYRYQVRLNGDVRSDVVYADEEGGFIDVYHRHNGQYVTLGPDRVLVDRLHGTVVIEEKSGQRILLN